MDANPQAVDARTATTIEALVVLVHVKIQAMLLQSHVFSKTTVLLIFGGFGSSSLSLHQRLSFSLTCLPVVVCFLVLSAGVLLGPQRLIQEPCFYLN